MRKLHWLWLYLATERPRVLLVGFGMQHRCRDKRAVDHADQRIKLVVRRRVVRRL